MGHLTTHVLDTANGWPAGGMAGRLIRPDGAEHDFVLNADGRCDAPLLQGEAFITGIYTLLFYTAAYFASAGASLTDPPFLDEIALRFGVADTGAHIHVPLLVSPWSFSTYRGS